MAEVVRRCIATLDGGGKLDHHVVTVDAEPAWVAADAARIEQIVTNLLSNSLKFTPRGGAIRVTVRRERDEAVLRVADDGAGISAELLPVVFDLFVQGDRGLDRRSGGLGVGLTLVRRASSSSTAVGSRRSARATDEAASSPSAFPSWRRRRRHAGALSRQRAVRRRSESWSWRITSTTGK